MFRNNKFSSQSGISATTASQFTGILLQENITHLSATGTWLLLESAYWHDIGKLFTPEFSAERLIAVMDGVTAEDSGKCFAWDGVEVLP